jgi:hypothetical protein
MKDSEINSSNQSKKARLVPGGPDASSRPHLPHRAVRPNCCVLPPLACCPSVEHPPTRAAPPVSYAPATSSFYCMQMQKWQQIFLRMHGSHAMCSTHEEMEWHLPCLQLLQLHVCPPHGASTCCACTPCAYACNCAPHAC